MRDFTIIACVRQEDLPVPFVASDPGYCDWCKKPVWVGRVTRSEIPTTPLVLCNKCYESDRGPKEVRLADMSEAGRSELRKRGFTDQEIDRVYEQQRARLKRRQ